MKSILFFIFTFYSFFLSAQITNIPDQNFEQALIDLGIDSDQTINGQVLTSDVAGVTSLDLGSNYFIQNLGGIEDFSSLKFLNLSDVGVESLNTPLDLSSLTDLEEFYFGGQGDVITNRVSEVILSNSPNLKLIAAGGNWPLDKVILKGGDINITDLEMHLGYHDWYPGYYDYTHYVCVEVTNATQAENQQGNYSDWQVYGYVSYSENCSLSTSNFSEIDFQLFPNPTTGQFQVNSQEEIKEIKVYSLNGREVLRYSTQEKYDVSQLQPGMYFVKIFTGDTSLIQKLIKT